MAYFTIPAFPQFTILESRPHLFTVHNAHWHTSVPFTSLDVVTCMHSVINSSHSKQAEQCYASNDSTVFEMGPADGEACSSSSASSSSLSTYIFPGSAYHHSCRLYGTVCVTHSMLRSTVDCPEASWHKYLKKADMCVAESVIKESVDDARKWCRQYNGTIFTHRYLC